MKLIEKIEKVTHYDATISREELLTIVAVAGYVGGLSKMRNILDSLASDARAILGIDEIDSSLLPWYQAACEELGCKASRSSTGLEFDDK